MDRTKTYTKGGDAGVEGTVYQINLLIVFLLNGLKRSDEWYLSTEDDAGKFDDLVLETPGGSIFLQAKHKKKKIVTFEDLLSTSAKKNKNAFSLPKYFFSYMEIKQKCKIEEAIICTNTDLKLDADLKQHVCSQTLKEESMLYCDSVDHFYYTFKHTIVPLLQPKVKQYYDENLQRENIPEDVICEDNIKDFLSSIKFQANYPNKRSLRTIVEKYISVCEYSRTLDPKVAYNFLFIKLQDWLKQARGVCLTKAHAKAYFCEMRSNEYSTILGKYDVHFEENNVPVKDASKSVWHVIPLQEHILNLIKIHRTFRVRDENEFLIVPYSDDDDDIKKLTIEAFQIPSFVYLIICLEDGTEFITEDICKHIFNTLTARKYKRVVLIGEEDNDMADFFKRTPLYSSVEEEIHFSDLDVKTRGRLVTRKNIVFQGRDTSLKDILNENIFGCIDSETLVKLIKNEKVTVGATLITLSDDVKSYYISRRFNLNNEIDKELGSLDKYKDKILLISDAPGMGKSTVLTYLGGIIKAIYPDLWVITIDINCYTKILLEFYEKGLKTITAIQLLNSLEKTELKTELEKHIFSLPGKVILMIDGVDEVSPDYKEIAMNLIMDCKEKPNFERIYLTTRPHLCADMERLLGVKSLSLNPFSTENQQEFFNKYWKRHLKLKKVAQIKKCQVYSRMLIAEVAKWVNDRKENTLAEVPLQTRMIAEIFQDKSKFEDEELGDWEGCSEFLTSNNTFPKFPKRINLVKLYRLFMLRKRHVFMYDQGRLTGNVIMVKAITEIYNRCQLYHQLIALKSVLRENEFTLFNTYTTLCELTVEEELILKLGIIQKVNDKLQFMHRTFAEFYVSECLLSELKCEEQNREFQEFFIDDMMIGSEYRIVRVFLDGLLQKELSSLPTTTFQAFSALDYNQRLYHQDNTFLHNLTRENCLSLLQFIFRCFALTDNQLQLDRVLDAFGKTLLHYASQMNINFVEYLMGNNAGVNAEDYDGYTPLFEAVVRNHTDIAKYLLDHGANVNHKLNNTERSALQELVSGPVTFDMIELLVQYKIDINMKDEDGRTALHDIFQSSDLEMVRFLVENGADIDSKCEKGNTPLHEACQWLYVPEQIKFLVESGGQVNGKNGKGETPLHVIAECGNTEIFKYMLKNGADVNLGDNEGCTVLHKSAHQKGLEVMEILLETCNVNLGDSYGNTALHKAAAAGDLAAVTFLIGKGADVHVGNDTGKTALHEAAAKNRLDVVEYLVENGSKVNATDRYDCTALHNTQSGSEIVKFLVGAGLDGNIACRIYGYTLLHYAIWKNNIDDVLFLIGNGADIEIKDRDGNSPFQCAVEKNNLDIARYLVDKGAKVQVTNKNGQTPLFNAVRRENLKMVGFLTELNINVNTQDKDNRTVLHEACCKGKKEFIVHLVEKGAEVKVMDNRNRSPLHDAIRGSPLEVIIYLVGHGAEVNTMDATGSTPLISACFKGDSGIVEYLVQKGAYVNMEDRVEYKPLTVGARWGSLELIESLIKGGGNVNVTDKEGLTPLHIAARWNKLDLVLCLLKNGANVNVKDKEGNTPLHHASMPHLMEMVKLLIENQGDINAKNDLGRTPLHAAAERECLNDGAYADLLNIIEYFIVSGAGVNAGDCKGQTALHAAVLRGHLDKVELLVSRGADVSIKDHDDCTALDCAFKKGRTAVIEYLKKVMQIKGGA